MARRAIVRHRPTHRRETLRPNTGQPAPQTPALQPQTLPVDPLYTGQVGNVNLNHWNEMVGINYDRSQIGQTYGFDQQGNLDPSNPYSIATNLQRRYQQAQRGTTNSFAAGGQLYSGALQHNLDEGTYQYNRSYDEARRAAAGAYQGLNMRENQSNFDWQTGLNTAGSDRLGRLNPQDVVPNTPKPGAQRRLDPTRTKDHAAAGLRRTGPNTYVGPNGTTWHRTANGTFARGKR